LRDIAAKCIDGTINGKSFGVMSDSEVKEHLVAAKGIGSWTADMFLIFTLGRTDVLPVLDLGIQKGFQILFNLRTLPDAKKMLKLSKPWEGHRTVASLYLWKVADAHKERKKVKKQTQKVIKKRNLSK
jgi:DNA-3-methyladenine glycosylase II